MSTNRTYIAALLLIGALAIVAPLAAMAANNYTPACTTINNTATISYSVGGVAQTPIQSNSGTPTTFYVGVKVDVIVTTMDSADVVVYPGSLATSLTFSVTNNGNAHQQYVLSQITGTSGVSSPFSAIADSYDGTSVTISPVSPIADLAPDASIAVTISAVTPTTVTNGQVAVYALQAQTRWVGGSSDVNASVDGTAVADSTIGSACTALSGGGHNIDVVIADGAGTYDAARDGANSRTSAFQVTAANLTITKSSSVVYDPVNCSAYGATPTCSGTPKGIPGAVVEYLISITNAASGTATNVSVSDLVDGNLTFYANGYAAGYGIQVSAPNLNAGAATNLTSAVDVDGATSPVQGDYGGTANTVAVTGIQIGNAQTATVKFRATVK